jgi:hypothetical protein
MRTKISPPELAKRWGLSPSKVLGWIKTGELRAIDVSTRRGGRPRYLIDLTDIALFEASRSVSPLPKGSQRRRNRSTNVIEFL